MTFREHMTERPPCNNGERDADRAAWNAMAEEAADCVQSRFRDTFIGKDLANQILAMRRGGQFAPTTPAPAPTHGERITNLIWNLLEDRPLGLARAPEERKRDLAAAIDAALASEVSATAPSDPGTLDAAYRDMAEAAGEQIRVATKLALKQNDGARDLKMWRAGLDRANGLVAAGLSRLHAALTSTGKAPAAERGES